ncbi:hypothetical protein M422DRAFT_785124 [Sphaerobolus stellatus SS14]|uniref:Uncharacterized protein n=1 Tax=Sphaerobolus stellatus (strain SS14) TaxID=990650 RepID=A0A0C9TCB0_SPHS4|nr:hypothetical protein M422DRAFT_785124 [Sphaerobolus stellatus SS14]
MSSSRKRQRPRRNSPDYTAGGDYAESSSKPSALKNLFIQAHEATIIRNRPDLAAAVKSHEGGGGGGGGKAGLIRWHGDSERDIWVDRYDARLLLDSIPGSSQRRDAPRHPPSPTGWSDLPSDSEDIFLMDPGEAEDLRHEKRRKLLDTAREERLRALREAEPDPIHDFENEKDKWGDDDEEPEATTRTLMERTATHLTDSPNPGQLEMRILANHGADSRFAFLRGRWKNSWQKIKSDAQSAKRPTVDLTKVQRSPKSNTAIPPKGGLVAYGSDSDDSD